MEDSQNGGQDAMSANSNNSLTVLNSTAVRPSTTTSQPCTSDTLAAPPGAEFSTVPSLCVRNISATSNITDKSDDNLDSCSRSSDSGNLGAAGDCKQEKTIEKSRSQKNLTEQAKKTPWYNAIYPSYKSRTEEFKKLFKEASDDERLIVDYSCAIQKDILIHGRLYVTQNYLCFYSNIIVWETRICIRWKDVTSISKEKTARVIPNAISVCTDNEKHFLTSFTSRDKAYLMLFRVWQNALMDKPINPQELWQWVHTCYGDQLGLTSDDEDYIDPYEKNSESIILTKQSSEELPRELTENSDESNAMMVSKETKPKKVVHQKTSFNADGNLSTPEMLPTDTSDSTESEKEEEFFASVECNSLHSGRQLVHTILPINVDILFELLFSKSKFLTEFHNSRKTTDMIHGEWKVNKDGLKERVVSLTIAITQTIGPRSAQVTETQVMRECSKPGQLYSIDVNAVQGGIPYADSFYVTQHYCMSKTKDDHTVLSVHAQVHYRKNIFGFVRGFIEKNTWVGLEDFYNALLRSLQSEYCIPPAKSKSRRSRKPIPSQHTKVIEEPSQRSVPLPIAAAIGSIKTTNSNAFFSWFVVVLLIILLSINVALYVKLWNLEGENEFLFINSNAFDRKMLKNPPQTHGDWMVLLHEQETKHAKEMVKWQQVLSTVTDLLNKVSSICENIPRNVTDDFNIHANDEL
ncbi:protein Aster-B-like [Toxorhynchites rutilus septentrionalis]|uniref:protein Aster-B-like n=1 Tax=Toxorhynchites rutilus septentrionalis TaxID=329112 RepID=UPI002479BC28|nr:protein Aster-B-like [Toxorhynchites rutilus septentrionalis]